MVVAPSAIAPRISARCEIDLSPGTLTVPLIVTPYYIIVVTRAALSGPRAGLSETDFWVLRRGVSGQAPVSLKKSQARIGQRNSCRQEFSPGRTPDGERSSFRVK